MGENFLRHLYVTFDFRRAFEQHFCSHQANVCVCVYLGDFYKSKHLKWLPFQKVTLGGYITKKKQQAISTLKIVRALRRTNNVFRKLFDVRS